MAPWLTPRCGELKLPAAEMSRFERPPSCRHPAPKSGAGSVSVLVAPAVNVAAALGEAPYPSEVCRLAVVQIIVGVDEGDDRRRADRTEPG